MLRQGAALEVNGAKELASALNDLLADPNRRRTMGRRALEVAEAHQGAFGLNLGLAERYL
jgi:3-deoxy-D-manno-octulosonic-acid transferase